MINAVKIRIRNVRDIWGSSLLATWPLRLKACICEALGWTNSRISHYNIDSQPVMVWSSECYAEYDMGGEPYPAWYICVVDIRPWVWGVNWETDC